MSNDGLSNSSGGELLNSVSVGTSSAPTSGNSESAGNIGSTTATSVVQLPAVVQKKHYDATEIGGLVLSITLAVMYYATHLHNVTYHMPTEGLMTDAILGLIVTPFAGKIAWWVQQVKSKTEK